MQYESSVDTGQQTLAVMDFTKEGGYFFDLFGRPPSYFGFEDFMNENCTTWMYRDVEFNKLVLN